jgi:hypothetical protein
VGPGSPLRRWQRLIRSRFQRLAVRPRLALPAVPVPVLNRPVRPLKLRALKVRALKVRALKVRALRVRLPGVHPLVRLLEV